MTLTSGTRLGPYEILSLLGAGGMGEVYRARDPRLGREVAIKLLPESFARDTDRLRRFEQEARAVAALNHPNILAVHDTGATRSTQYIVTELLQGETLRDRFAKGPLSLRRATDYGAQIARGLAAAHDKGIVHRDLKPENLFITENGTVKILDFGLAKQSPQLQPSSDGATLGSTAQTSAGTVMGTAGYMAPEQVRGEATDHRCDIFAFGSVLCEMLTGQRAFQRNSTVETMAAILNEDPSELDTNSGQRIPSALARIAHRCLEKNPAQRFQSAKDLSFALENVSATTSQAEAVVPVPITQNRWRMLALVFAGLLIVAVGMAVHGFLTRPLQPTFQQLTFRRGFIAAARFGPDGQTITYAAAWEHPPLKLYAAHADGTDTRALDLPPSELLSVSRRGELATLLNGMGRSGWGLGSRLAQVPPGGAPRELLDNVVAADWSPGGQLAVARLENGKCRLEYPVGKVLYENLGYINNMRFSPRGDSIAFMDHPVAGDDRGTVAWVDVKGNRRIVTPEWEGEDGLAWSPNAGEIWFTATSSGEHRALYAVTTSGKRRTVLSIPGSLHLQDIGPTGRVLLTSRQFRWDVVLGSSSSTRQLSWSDIMRAPALSLDGAFIVMDDLSSPETDYRVYLAKLDGSPAVLLGSGYAGSGSISPDNKWVASILPSDLSKVRLLPTGVGETKSVTAPDFRYRYADWTSDGRQLVVIGNQSGHPVRCWVQSIDSNVLRAVTPEGIEGSPVTVGHSDYVSARDASGVLRLYSIDGSEPITAKGVGATDEVVGHRQDSDTLSVTPDSFAIPLQVFRVNIRSGVRERIASISPGDADGVLRIVDPLIFPGGKQWVATEVRVLSTLYMTDGLK